MKLPAAAPYAVAIPPRNFVAPANSKANSAQDVQDLVEVFGLILDDWQCLVLWAGLGERFDGKWAAPRVGFSIPRQNGKSKILLARALAGALLFREKKIIISAHLQDTAREIYADFKALYDESPALRGKVKRIFESFNRERIEFHNGSIIYFKARTGPGGRGFSCDCLLLDEAQRLSRAAWVSINSTKSSRPNPQVWLTGTVPTAEDDSDVFESFRRLAIEGQDTAAAWIDWAALATDDPAVEATRRSANPAWDTRINHEEVEGEYLQYKPHEFAIDRLGIWPKRASGSRLISEEQWAETGVDVAPSEGVKTFGIAFSKTGERVSICGAMHADGTTHVELIDKQSGSTDGGVGALATWLADSKRKESTAEIGICGGDAETLRMALVKAGVPKKMIRIFTTTDYVAACAETYNAVKENTLTHLVHVGQTVLDESVEITDRKSRGANGAWGWVATTDDGDETPVEAMSVALYAARTTKRRPGRKTKGAVL